MAVEQDARDERRRERSLLLLASLAAEALDEVSGMCKVSSIPSFELSIHTKRRLRS